MRVAIVTFALVLAGCVTRQSFNEWRAGDCFKVRAATYIVRELGDHGILALGPWGEQSFSWDDLRWSSMPIDCFGKFDK